MIGCLIGCLDDPEEAVRAAAIRALGRIGAPAAPPLVRALKLSVNRRFSAALADSLACIGALAVDELINSLIDRDPDALLACLWAPGKAGDKRAVWPII